MWGIVNLGFGFLSSWVFFGGVTCLYNFLLRTIWGWHWQSNWLQSIEGACPIFFFSFIQIFPPPSHPKMRGNYWVLKCSSSDMLLTSNPTDQCSPFVQGCASFDCTLKMEKKGSCDLRGLPLLQIFQSLHCASTKREHHYGLCKAALLGFCSVCSSTSDQQTFVKGQ